MGKWVYTLKYKIVGLSSLIGTFIREATIQVLQNFIFYIKD